MLTCALKFTVTTKEYGIYCWESLPKGHFISLCLFPTVGSWNSHCTCIYVWVKYFCSMPENYQASKNTKSFYFGCMTKYNKDGGTKWCDGLIAVTYIKKWHSVHFWLLTCITKLWGLCGVIYSVALSFSLLHQVRFPLRHTFSTSPHTKTGTHTLYSISPLTQNINSSHCSPPCWMKGSISPPCVAISLSAPVSRLAVVTKVLFRVFAVKSVWPLVTLHVVLSHTAIKWPFWVQYNWPLVLSCN